MKQIFCGKYCDECPERETKGCPGCLDGPGNPNGGDCPIAACCRESHFQGCDECSREESCALRNPAIPLREQEEARARQLREGRRIIPQVTLLCVILVLQLIVTACGSDSLDVDPLNDYETYLDMAIQLFCGVTLLSMWQACPRFSKAGRYLLICVILDLLKNVFSNEWLHLLVLILLLVFYLTAVFQELYGFSDLTAPLDPGLSGHWRRLWSGLFWLMLIVFPMPFLTRRLFLDMSVVYLLVIILLVVTVFLNLWHMSLLIRTIQCLTDLEDPPYSAAATEVSPAEENAGIGE